MADDRASRVADVFGAAWELPVDERAGFLDEACAGDAELRREVCALLDAEAGAREPLEMSRMLALLDDDARPSHAGPFRLIREIGRGGMGRVYLGEREGADFTQRVAIKIVRDGLNTDDLVVRFRRERQILASLDHPSVSRLVDGGVLDDGRPWLAMEYVDGQPLLAWCDERRLDLAARLRLFERVCRAVHHAHARLIAHLDLKPSNVLVTNDGVVKLLDFGIAKLLAEPAERSPDAAATAAPVTADVTRGGPRPLTPRYAAPEQRRGEAVSVATDVFALGVLLCELVTGCAPTDDTGETRPLPPSRLVGDDAARAATRGTRPMRLAAMLRGDVDAIVMRALAHDPTARYPGADALADDLARHLAGEVVLARRASRAYRIGRFVRRHRLGVALAGLAVVALIAGAAIARWQAHVAERERDRAHRETIRTATTRDFLIDLFESADPARARGKELTAQEILERGVEQIDRGLGAEPALHADMLVVLGGTFHRLGRYDQAAGVLERALEIGRSLADPAIVARALTRLAETRSMQGRPTEAERMLRETLVLRLGGGATGAEVAETLDGLAVTLAYQNRFEAAEPLYRDALAIRRRVLGEHHGDTLDTKQNLANTEVRLGRPSIAVRMHREVLAAFRKQHGELHPTVSSSLGNLAVAVRATGDYGEAVDLQRRALAIEIELRGKTHPHVATRRNNLAGALYTLGELAEAETQFREVLASDRQNLGERHPYVGITLDNLASVLIERGTLDEAGRLLDEADKIFAAANQKGGALATHLERRALWLAARGQLAAALAQVETAIKVHDRGKGTATRLAFARRLRGTIHERANDLAKAQADYRAVLDVQRAHYPERHPDIATTLLDLGRLLVRRGRRSEATALLREAAVIRQHAFPPANWRRAEAGVAWRACGGARPSDDDLARLVVMIEAALGAHHATVARARGLVEACAPR